MKIEMVDIGRVSPYERNPRKNDAAVEKVKASLQEFGFRQPIVVDAEFVVVAGHTRLQAARALGMAQVPVHVAEGLTAEQVRAYRLADNRTSQEAEWDYDLLGMEIKDLKLAGIDLATTGFDEDELAKLLLDDTAGLTDPEDTPEVEARVISKPGDLWLLGRHRILCGDATSADDVGRLLGGVEPHLMVTDPPYGVEYDADWRNHALRADGSPSAGRAVGKVANDDKADWREAWALFPGDVAYVWHAYTKSHIVAASLADCEFEMRAQLIWAKSNFAIGRGHYHPKHEPCWYAVRKGKTGHWAGDRKQTTVWDIPKPSKSDTGHSTQKPVECMKRPIENNSSVGQAVYEPFSGSGTTIIAGEMTGRSILAMEITPAYVDVAVRRWQTFTGKHAKLESTGQAFSEVEAETPAAAAA